MNASDIDSITEFTEHAKDHFKIVCKDCDVVITQCRCMSRGKEIFYARCDKCEKKPIKGEL